MNTLIRRLALAAATVGALALIPLAALPASAATGGTPPPGVAFTGDPSLIQQVYPAHFPHTHLPERLHVTGTIPQQSVTAQSTNWSGYADRACSTCSLRYVAATFTVPSVNCAKNTTATEYDASEWVGLDGLTSSTVEQTGVDGQCQGSTGPWYYAWYEMYPLYPVTFTIRGLRPGDTVNVSVYYGASAHKYQLTFKDVTRGVGFTTNQPCPAHASCQNKSAEVITEEPTAAPGANGNYLADFGQVSYRNATVTSRAGYHGNLGDKSGLWTSWQLSIWNSNTGDQQTQPGPLHSSGNYSAFTDTWRAAN